MAGGGEPVQSRCWCANLATCVVRAAVPEAMTVSQESAVDARRRRGVLAACFVLALATALYLELWTERGEPLWLDEAWSIAIAGQRSWLSFYHQVYWDVNAPLYYLLLHLWQGAFGLSDLSLRIPSLALTVATPLSVALSRPPGLPREDRLAWAAILALWFPSLSFAQEARSYALLLLISTLQLLAFIRLLHTPRTGCAVIWASLAGLAILTHYDAIFSAAIQGLTYLAVYRLAAVRTWPAALAFVPAFAWLAFHLARIVQFARPDIAWYSPLKPADLRDVFGFLAGTPQQLWGLLIVGLGMVVLRFAWPRRVRPLDISSRVWLAVLPAGLAAVALVIMGFLRPSFAPRYLTPEGPGVLLGLVLLARGMVGRRLGFALVGLVASFAVVSSWRISAGARMAPRQYNYERASEALEKVNPRRLVFLWDHPVDPILHPEQLAAAGGAFFHRDGFKIAVAPVVLTPGQDPNRVLLADAASPGSVILWVYDTVVQGTAARRFPPQIDDLNPTWTCDQYGRGRFGVYACQKAGQAR